MNIFNPDIKFSLGTLLFISLTLKLPFCNVKVILRWLKTVSTLLVRPCY